MLFKSQRYYYSMLDKAEETPQASSRDVSLKRPLKRSPMVKKPSAPATIKNESEKLRSEHKSPAPIAVKRQEEKRTVPSSKLNYRLSPASAPSSPNHVQDTKPAVWSPTLRRLSSAPTPLPSMQNAKTVSIATSSSNGHADLMAQIQGGIKLRNVGSPVEKSGFAVGNANVDNCTRMMEQIRLGAPLKKVNDSSDKHVKRKSSTPNIQKLGGIVGALARAMQERRKEICLADQYHSTDDTDSEWNE